MLSTVLDMEIKWKASPSSWLHGIDMSRASFKRQQTNKKYVIQSWGVIRGWKRTEMT